MKALITLAVGACALPVVTASAQNFAIEPLGFTSVSGTSTDGNFAVSGTFTPTATRPLSGGDFGLSGDIRSVVGSHLYAGPELIVNGSFENTEATFVADGFGLMSLPPGSGAIPGWNTTAAELAWVDDANTFGAATPYGTHSLDLTGYHDNRPYGGLTQTIPTEPGRTYRLTLALGSNADYPNAGGPKSVLVCVGSAGAAIAMTPTNGTGNQWQTFGFGFTATSAATEVSILGLSRSGNYLGLDNVSVVLDYSAPPPSAGELVANGNFEEACDFLPDGNGVMALAPGSSGIPGWTTTAAELAWAINGNAFGPRSPHGSLFLDLTGYHDVPPYGGITQMLATTPGRNYRLTFALGSHEDTVAYRGPQEVAVSIDSVSQSFRFTPTGQGSQWGTFTMYFTANSAATALTFQGLTSTGGAYLGLDNISVVPVLAIPRATIVGVNQNEVNARFPVAPGATYSVEMRPSLLIGEWLPVSNTTYSGAGTSLEVSLPYSASESQRYYRLRQIR